MSFIDKIQAYPRAGKIYVAQPNHAGEMKQCGFKHVGMCFALEDRVGFFKTRRDFEEFISSLPEVFAPIGEHTHNAFKAETRSTFDGKIILKKLVESAKRLREPAAEAP